MIWKPIIALLVAASFATAGTPLPPDARHENTSGADVYVLLTLAPGDVFANPTGRTLEVLNTRQPHDLADAVADPEVLAHEAALLGSIIIEQRGIIDVRDDAYIHYRDLWTETDSDLEEAEVEVDKLKRDRGSWSLVPAAVVGVTAFLIGSSID